MSLGRDNTEEDVQTVLRELPAIVEKLRRITAFNPQD